MYQGAVLHPREIVPQQYREILRFLQPLPPLHRIGVSVIDLLEFQLLLGDVGVMLENQLPRLGFLVSEWVQCGEISPVAVRVLAAQAGRFMGQPRVAGVVAPGTQPFVVRVVAIGVAG